MESFVIPTLHMTTVLDEEGEGSSHLVSPFSGQGHGTRQPAMPRGHTGRWRPAAWRSWRWVGQASPLDQPEPVSLVIQFSWLRNTEELGGGATPGWDPV